jgi:hypothetical protein
MNKKLLKALQHWPKPFISGLDLNVLLNKSDDSKQAIIKRAVDEKFLIRVKNDLYLIQHLIEKNPIDAFEIASLIYGPSYVSFESALNFHGWIPEAVKTTTSACSKRSKTFETPIGIFKYEHIPIDIFHIGISEIHKNNIVILMADPWKAVSDYIYVRKKNWSNLKSLLEDLRIEPDYIFNSDKLLLQVLSEKYPNLRTRKILKNLLKGVVAWF